MLDVQEILAEWRDEFNMHLYKYKDMFLTSSKTIEATQQPASYLK